MTVKVNLGRCKQCGLCIAFCPESVFDKAFDESPIPARLEDCIGCRQCVLRCPDFAIEVGDNI